MSGAALQAEGVVKRYGDAVVLNDVAIALRGGRVDGLIGRNGAGKSTLVNVLTGRTAADAGTITVGGAALSPRGPADALAAGVVAVPQELVMPLDMTVTEVVTFGAEPTRGAFLARRRADREVGELLASIGLDVDVRRRVSELPVSWQRVVLLAQALHREARVLILDEPTAAMNAEDCQRVLAVVRRLRERGPGDPLHQPPLRRGRAALRPRHRDGRRPRRRRDGGRRADARAARAGDHGLGGGGGAAGAGRAHHRG